jgi:hypothetical protein
VPTLARTRANVSTGAASARKRWILPFPLRNENDIMSNAPQVKPGERDPVRPPGLAVVAIAAIALGALMCVLLPGHGPIQGHVTAPAADATKS